MKPKFEIEQTKMSTFWLQRKDGEYDGLHADYKKASTLMKSTISLKALRYALRSRKIIWIL